MMFLPGSMTPPVVWYLSFTTMPRTGAVMVTRSSTPSLGADALAQIGYFRAGLMKLLHRLLDR